MGPAAWVLLARPLAEGAAEELAEWLAAISDRVQPVAGAEHLLSRQWQVSGLNAARLALTGAGRDDRANCVVEVAISDGIAESDDPTREEAVRSALGYLPVQRIAVAAGGNGRADHYVTAALATQLAERYHGVIDLLGALMPPDMPWRSWHLAGRQGTVSDPGQRTADSLEAISSYVTAMPGTVHEIYYDLSEHQIWVWHIVDVAFLRAWLHNPHFHMIK
jgi:hypothetical protein